MEKRRLDLNKPLLSARRFTSPRGGSPELAQWHVSKRESEAISKHISIPFNWEQTPGRPKNEPQTVASTPKLNSGIPKLPPGRQSGPSRELSGDHNTIFRKLNDSISCKGELDSSEEEEIYMDAHNSLSPMEAWSDSKQANSRRFCADEVTREFMMSQFLPAAKAAVLEKPLKKVMISEKPKEESKVVSGELLTKLSIVKQNGLNGSNGSSQCFWDLDFNNVESKEDEELSSVAPVKKPGRHSRGINIHGICVNLKNKLHLMRSKSRPSTPSKVEEKRFQRKSFSGPLNKTASHVTPKKKFYSGLISRDTHRVESSYNNRPSNYHQLINLPNRSRFSPLRRSRSSNISSYHSKSPKFTSGDLLPPYISKKEYASKLASSRKMFMALQEVSRANQVNENLVEEKTLHVDSNSISGRTVKPGQGERGRLSSGYADVKQWVKYGERSINSSINGEWDEYDLPLKSHLRPPLPKSPSESWLSRTLPSIHMGSPIGHSRLGSPIHYKKHGRKDDCF